MRYSVQYLQSKSPAYLQRIMSAFERIQKKYPSEDFDPNTLDEKLFDPHGFYVIGSLHGYPFRPPYAYLRAPPLLVGLFSCQPPTASSGAATAITRTSSSRCGTART